MYSHANRGFGARFYNGIVPRKPKPMPFPQGVDPKQRFNATLTALLAVNKAELQAIDEKLKAIQKEKERHKTRSIDK